MKGLAWRGSTLAYGDYGMQALDRGWIDSRQIEAARKVIVKHTKRKGKTWLMIFPHKPVTAKSSEIKRGGGKGEVDHYVAVIKPGRVIFELGGIDEETAIYFEISSTEIPNKNESYKEVIWQQKKK